jgi:hypothetical protein
MENKNASPNRSKPKMEKKMENKHLIEVTEAGLGREVNPYSEVSMVTRINSMSQLIDKYDQFKSTVKTYYAFTTNNESLPIGKHVCEIVYQIRFKNRNNPEKYNGWMPICKEDFENRQNKGYHLYQTRQIYRLLPPLSAKTNEVKGVFGFETEYQLQEFREIEPQYFDANGKGYTGTIFSLDMAERMLKLINQLETELKNQKS